jgi:hypothetical protein
MEIRTTDRGTTYNLSNIDDIYKYLCIEVLKPFGARGENFSLVGKLYQEAKKVEEKEQELLKLRELIKEFINIIDDDANDIMIQLGKGEKHYELNKRVVALIEQLAKEEVV